MLNDLAYKKYEAPKNNSTVEDILLNQRYLPIVFSLVEKIIKYISSVGENEGMMLNLNIYSHYFISFLSAKICTLGIMQGL